jgi:RNA polymerase sigma-70 factor (ECF subfamily)
MPYRNFSDEQIVRLIQKGDFELYSLIVERYQDRVFSIGMRFFYDRDDAADFTQEVFLKAFKKIDAFREIALFRYWLVKLAYNHGINLKKSRNDKNDKIADFNYENIQSGYELPEKSHIYSEIKQILAEEINRLPERYRICIDFYFFLGLKYNEISEITGYPVNTIKSDVLRAKNILRQKLKGTIAEDYYEMQ